MNISVPKMLPRLVLGALLATGATGAFVATAAPAPALAQSHWGYRGGYYHGGYGGYHRPYGFVARGWYHPGYYWGPRHIWYRAGYPAYAYAPGYYAPGPYYYGPAYYARPAYVPSISLGFFFGGHGGWRR